MANSTASELRALVVFCFFIAAATYAYWKLINLGPRSIVDRFVYYIPYFFLGYLIRFEQRAPSKGVLWGTFLLSTAATFLGCYFLSEYRDISAGLYFYGFLSVTVIPMSIVVMILLKSLTWPIVPPRQLKKLSLLTLGVYLIHPVILDVMAFAGFGALDFPPAVSVPLLALVASALSLAGAWVLSRIPYLDRTIGINGSRPPQERVPATSAAGR